MYDEQMVLAIRLKYTVKSIPFNDSANQTDYHEIQYWNGKTFLGAFSTINQCCYIPWQTGFTIDEINALKVFHKIRQ